MLFKKIIVLLCLSFLLVACEMGSGQSVGTLLGATAGAVGGSNVGKGHGRVAAIAVGTLAGAFLGGALGKNLDKKDVQYHNNTSQRTLETVPVGSTQTWNNPDSGNYGTITPTRTYNDHGRYCREFTQSIVVGGKTEEGYGTACRMEDGTWKIVK